MRTTLNLDDTLLATAKRRAVQSGRTLTEFVEEALRGVIYHRKKSPLPSKTVLKTYRGKGLQPGVDLDDTASLLDLMENSHS